MSNLTKEILDSPIKTIEGRSAVEFDGGIITFRKALVSCCGIYQPQGGSSLAPQSPAQAGEEAIRAYDLGLRIHQAKEDVKLSESDIELLKKIISTNRIYVAFITAQLFKLLEKLSKIGVKVEDKT